jgi:hypothetical protein
VPCPTRGNPSLDCGQFLPEELARSVLEMTERRDNVGPWEPWRRERRALKVPPAAAAA